MYAVIRSGGKQYKVTPGQLVKLEKLEGEKGQKVDFDQVLLVAEGDNIKMGAPYVNGAKVKAEVVDQGRHKKIHIIKFRRRKHYMKQQGHRQYFTQVKILEIAAA